MGAVQDGTAVSNAECFTHGLLRVACSDAMVLLLGHGQFDTPGPDLSCLVMVHCRGIVNLKSLLIFELRWRKRKDFPLHPACQPSEIRPVWYDLGCLCTVRISMPFGNKDVSAHILDQMTPFSSRPHQVGCQGFVELFNSYRHLQAVERIAHDKLAIYLVAPSSDCLCVGLLGTGEEQKLCARCRLIASQAEVR